MDAYGNIRTATSAGEYVGGGLYVAAMQAVGGDGISAAAARASSAATPTRTPSTT